MGHNLGMFHDFVGDGNTRSLRKDSNGTNCTDIFSIMDYYQVFFLLMGWGYQSHIGHL